MVYPLGLDFVLKLPNFIIYYYNKNEYNNTNYKLQISISVPPLVLAGTPI